jgi:hypothetical protein
MNKDGIHRNFDGLNAIWNMYVNWEDGCALVPLMPNW